MTVFAPTHTVPTGGLDAWDQPDPDSSPSARLDPWLAVQVTGRNGGWTRILCANGWSAWVDGAVLVPGGAAAGPPAAVGPAAAGAPAGGTAAMGPTAWMTVGGGVAVAIAGFLPWVSLDLGILGKLSESAFKIPLEFLWNLQPAAVTGSGTGSLVSIGLALLVLGVVGGGTALVPGLDLVRRAAGGAAAVVASDFVRQMSSALGQLNTGQGAKIGVLDVLGIGVYLALGGSALILIGSGRKRAPAVAA